MDLGALSVLDDKLGVGSLAGKLEVLVVALGPDGILASKLLGQDTGEPGCRLVLGLGLESVIAEGGRARADLGGREVQVRCVAGGNEAEGGNPAGTEERCGTSVNMQGGR